MNWVLITVGAIFLISIIIGIYKGALRIAVSLATTLVTLLAVFFLAPHVAGAIEKYTPVDEMLEKTVSRTMENALSDYLTEGIEDILGEEGISTEDEDEEDAGIAGSLLDGMEIPRDLQQEAISAADLPKVFKELLSVNNNDEIYDELGVETFTQYVARYLSRLVINIVSFLGVFLLITIILRAIIFALDIVEDLPVLGILNRLAGGAVGFACALLIVWILFIVVTLAYTTMIGKDVYEIIQDNSVLKMLYDCNPIMKMATRI